MAEMRDSTLKITPECLADILALPEFDSFSEDDIVDGNNNLWFSYLEYEDDINFSNGMLAVLHKHQVNGHIHLYQGISNYGRMDDSDYGYEFEDGIMYQLETVVTWRRVETQQ